MSDTPPSPLPPRLSPVPSSSGSSPQSQLHFGRTISPPPPPRPNSNFVVKRPNRPTSPSPVDNLSTEPSTSATTPGAQSLPRLNIPGPKPPGRRVQWPVDLKSPVGGNSGHISIPMPLQTMEDHGAKEALRTALDALEKQELDAPRPSFTHDLESQVPSETTTRAPSEAGSEDMEDIRDQMDVYVDPNETDGMPSLRPEKDAQRNQDAAAALVRAHTSGFFGVLRKRKGRNVKRSGPAVTPTREDSTQPVPDDGTGAFGRRLRDANADTNYDEFPLEPKIKRNQGHTGGVLASLLALQGGGGGGGSETDSLRSAATSSAFSSRPNSTYGSEEDDEDDERERLKFIHEYRVKNQWLKHGGAQTPKSHPRETSAVSPEDSRNSFSNTRQNSSSLVNFVTNRSSGLFNPPLPESPGSPPTTADSTVALRPPKTAAAKVGSTMKKLGGSLGLEFDQRPTAAKSSAGVFGGLMMATTNLAGAASPGTAKIAPDPTHHGFGIARYDEEGSKNPSPAKRPTSMKDLTMSPGSNRSSTTLEGDSPSKGKESKSNPSSPRLRKDSGLPPLKQVKSSSHVSDLKNQALISPPITLTDTHTEQTTALHTSPSPPVRPSPLVSSSFAENAKKRRSASGFKGLENLTLNMIQAPIKLAKVVTHTHGTSTPDGKNSGDFDYFGPKAHLTQEEKEKKAWEKEKRRRKKAREKKKQEQIFITMHVAAILARQDFLLKLTRGLMMFGAPSHRLEAQMQATARVLELNCQMVYIPGVMLVSFGDNATHTSETKFLKQANGLDLGKLLSTHMVYWNVVHDKIGVTEASEALDVIMTSKPTYKFWQHLIIGGLASALIQPSAFYGSFIDCLVAIPLGMLLVIVQVLVSKNDLYSSLFEIVIAALNSFLAAAIASSNTFCFAAIASGSVVLILPGYIVLVGALEIGNRSIISGSVRMVYAVLYSLFLGFGLAMGCEIWIRITGLTVSGATDYQCTSLRKDAPWYRATISPWFYFLTAPLYLLMLSLRNGQPFFRKETVIMVVIGCAGFSCNYLTGRYLFSNRPDITSAIGSFVVGILGGIYAKFTRGSAFVVMVAGILFQLPSGLANGGLLKFAAETTSTDSNTQSTAYSSGFAVAEQLVQTAIGLTVGLFVSASFVNFFGGGRRRGSNLSSF